MQKNLFIIVALILLPLLKLSAQCAQTANIYSFSYGGHSYEVVKELKSWTDAAACAVERGGYLVSINSVAENNYIMGQLTLTTAANISSNYHPVTDGGGASYIWTGGTDKNTEGVWLWDGDNNDVGTNFYTGQGTAGSGNGVSVGGAYINWGCSSLCEPDNYFYLHDQDALGLAMGSWPYGLAGQWNDIDMFNTLYFIIEKDGTAPQPCSTPTSLNSYNETSTSAEIYWTSNAPNFNIEYKESTATTWSTIASANDTLQLTGLSVNTAYNFQVKAICSSTPTDTSVWSAVANFTTLDNVGIEENSLNKIKIYPNPANDFIQISGIESLNSNIIIVSINGKKIKEYKFSELSEGKININNLSKGVYFIKVIEGQKVIVSKFVKE